MWSAAERAAFQGPFRALRNRRTRRAAGAAADLHERQAARLWCRCWAISRSKPAHLIVIHDELDLSVGTVRIKRGGGHGGNNGLRSIIDSLGTGDFVRIRIGVGRPPQGRDAVGFLLQPMTRAELAAYEPVIERAAEAAEAIVTSGVAPAMNKFNQRA